MSLELDNVRCEQGKEKGPTVRMNHEEDLK